MKLKLKAFGSFRNVLGRETVPEMPEGSTVRQMLLKVIPANSQSMIFDEKGRLKEEVNVLRGGKNLENQGGLDCILTEGDELAIFSAVVGG